MIAHALFILLLEARVVHFGLFGKPASVHHVATFDVGAALHHGLKIARILLPLAVGWRIAVLLATRCLQVRQLQRSLLESVFNAGIVPSRSGIAVQILVADSGGL